MQLAVFLQRQAAIQTTVIDQLRVRFDVQSGVAPKLQTVIVIYGVCSFLDRERFARRYGEDRAAVHRDAHIPRDCQIVGERDRRVEEYRVHEAGVRRGGKERPEGFLTLRASGQLEVPCCNAGEVGLIVSGVCEKGNFSRKGGIVRPVHGERTGVNKDLAAAHSERTVLVHDDGAVFVDVKIAFELQRAARRDGERIVRAGDRETDALREFKILVECHIARDIETLGSGGDRLFQRRHGRSLRRGCKVIVGVVQRAGAAPVFDTGADVARFADVRRSLHGHERGIPREETAVDIQRRARRHGQLAVAVKPDHAVVRERLAARYGKLGDAGNAQIAVFRDRKIGGQRDVVVREMHVRRIHLGARGKVLADVRFLFRERDQRQQVLIVYTGNIGRVAPSRAVIKEQRGIPDGRVRSVHGELAAVADENRFAVHQRAARRDGERTLHLERTRVVRQCDALRDRNALFEHHAFCVDIDVDRFLGDSVLQLRRRRDRGEERQTLGVGGGGAGGIYIVDADVARAGPGKRAENSKHGAVPGVQIAVVRQRDALRHRKLRRIVQGETPVRRDDKIGGQLDLRAVLDADVNGADLPGSRERGNDVVLAHGDAHVRHVLALNAAHGADAGGVQIDAGVLARLIGSVDGDARLGNDHRAVVGKRRILLHGDARALEDVERVVVYESAAGADLDARGAGAGPVEPDGGRSLRREEHARIKE